MNARFGDEGARALVIFQQALGTGRLVGSNCDDRLLPASHFALRVEPVREVAPGAEIRFFYRATNPTAVTGPGARIRFILPPEIELAPDQSATVELSPLAPGATVELPCCARVRRPLPDGLLLTVQAALELHDAPALGSNRVELRVRSAARLDGARSFVRIDATEEPDVVQVVARIENDGDDVVRDARLIVPPPVGTQVCSPSAESTFSLIGLLPGSSVLHAYRARLIVPPPAAGLCVRDARIVDSTGLRAALPPSDFLTFGPELAAPSIVCLLDRRRIHVTIRAANGGWSACPSAIIALTWPHGFSLAGGSLARDGAPVTHARRQATNASIELGELGARSETCLSFDLYAGPNAERGSLDVMLKADAQMTSASAELLSNGNDDVRLTSAHTAREAVEAGTIAPLDLDVWNAGYRTRTIVLESEGAIERVRIGGKPMRADGRVTLAPGEHRPIAVDIRIPIDALDDSTIGAAIRVRDENGQLVSADCSIVARQRVAIDADAWLRGSATDAAIVLTNRGTTAAREAVVETAHGTHVNIGTIAARETVRVPILPGFAAQAAHGAVLRYHGGEIMLAATTVHITEPALNVSFEPPETVRAGEMRSVHLQALSSTPIETLALRVTAHDGLTIVAGSLRVNDCALPDRLDGVAIQSAEGLILHAISERTPIDVCWSVIAPATLDASRTVDLRANLEVDGIACDELVASIILVPQHAFAVREAELPFHVDGLAFAPCVRPTIEVPLESSAFIEPSSASSPLALVCDLSPIRRVANARFLRGAIMPGLISHVFSLRALFPDYAASRDPILDARIEDARGHLRRVLDRLYVKSRIPAYCVRAHELDDLGLRSAIAALAFAIDDVPSGGPALLACIGALSPDIDTDEPLASTWNAYRAMLVETLTTLAGSPQDDVDSELVATNDPLLDRARAALIDALEAVEPVLAG